MPRRRRGFRLLARDVTEIVEQLGLRPPPAENAAQGLRVAYHSACSMQHGQQLHRVPKALLTAAGFETIEVPEGHVCCGSAGTYNLLQPEIAGRLRDRKLANIAKTRPDVVATGNIGCITQLMPGSDVPVVHTVELLDWATGGPEPTAMRSGYPARRRARAGISKVSPKCRRSDHCRRQPTGAAQSQLVLRLPRDRHRRLSSATGRSASRTRKEQAASASAPARN